MFKILIVEGLHGLYWRTSSQFVKTLRRDLRSPEWIRWYPHTKVFVNHMCDLPSNPFWTSLTPRGDDVLGFDTRWDEVLLSIKESPKDNILENMHKMRQREQNN